MRFLGGDLQNWKHEENGSVPILGKFDSKLKVNYIKKIT